MNKPKDEPGLQTILSHCGRNLEASGGYVNVPPYEGSTIIHDDMDDLFGRVDNHLYGDGTARTYGTDGGPTHEAFYEAMNKLEGGVGTWAFSTGLAGCTIPMMAFLKTGDHMLVTDSVYGPTRQFCEVLLKKFRCGSRVLWTPIGAGIEGLIRPNTRLIYMESPGTHTFEMQDVPAIAAGCTQARSRYDDRQHLCHADQFPAFKTRGGCRGAFGNQIHLRSQRCTDVYGYLQ